MGADLDGVGSRAPLLSLRAAVAVLPLFVARPFMPLREQS